MSTIAPVTITAAGLPAMRRASTRLCSPGSMIAEPLLSVIGLPPPTDPRFRYDQLLAEIVAAYRSLVGR